MGQNKYRNIQGRRAGKQNKNLNITRVPFDRRDRGVVITKENFRLYRNVEKELRRTEKQRVRQKWRWLTKLVAILTTFGKNK